MIIIQKYFTSKSIIASIALLYCISTLWGLYKPLPKNISYISPSYYTDNISFLYDLTYTNKNTRIIEQSIFNEINNLIIEADDYIVLDFFLFNDTYNTTDADYIDIGGLLTQALITKKNTNPDINIIFITDPINNFYGVYETQYIKALKDNNIKVIISNLDNVRDSNFLYDGFYDMGLRFLPIKGFQFIPNIFATSKEKTNITGILRLLRFKANHRKVVITDKSALIASANPHNPSSLHSNIAYRIDGNMVNELLIMEEAVAQSANQSLNIPINTSSTVQNKDQVEVRFASESKIKNEILKNIDATNSGDEICIASFYLSHQKIIKKLIEASKRDVSIKIILDENKDAFGLKKNGVPNKPVASHLVKASNGKIQLKWYETTGEQFHTKLMIFKIDSNLISIGGSANFTRRNLDDFNYELDVITKSSSSHPFSISVNDYFYRLWENKNGIYTKDYTNDIETPLYKTIQYYIQEQSGISTF